MDDLDTKSDRDESAEEQGRAKRPKNGGTSGDRGASAVSVGEQDLAWVEGHPDQQAVAAALEESRNGDGPKGDTTQAISVHFAPFERMPRFLTCDNCTRAGQVCPMEHDEDSRWGKDIMLRRCHRFSLQGRVWRVAAYIAKGADGQCYELEEVHDPASASSLAAGGSGPHTTCTILNKIPTTTHKLCLKLFAEETLKDGTRYSKGEKEVAFLQANCTSAAFAHPNIVGIHAIGDALPFASTHPHLTRQFSIMPMVANGDLYNFTGHLRPMDHDIIRCIIRQLADALAHLHAQGIAHRDIKAENVMLNDQAQPMLADFGKVRMEEERVEEMRSRR